MTGRSDGGWGTPSRGWDRTALRTSNVCHSRKLMMPRSWANHPPAACGKKDRHTERGLRVVLLSHGCSQKRWDALAGWGGGGAWGWKFKVQEYLWQSTPQLAPLSDFEMNDIPPSSFFPITVLSPSFIKSRFMRISANFICSQSLRCYLILPSEKGDGDWCFGCSAEIVIIYSQLGNSNLGDKGEMEEGWGLKSGKMLRADNRIWSSTRQM